MTVQFCYWGFFAVAEHEYRDVNALLSTWCPEWTVSRCLLTKLITRELSRSQNTNIVTATLPEVPGAQGEQYHDVSWSFMKN
ncbi:hypothetical protein TSAR_001372 [Trichomalopsis sarcophagae]|uniref:Uncharacterized protein n=1 Tax=Trichomalopsis sarcophagae TaxID=543379 RepID=A0A232EZC7_9HYME|nr:hypothetical protein TSAR_001372 [Trichomalopsis sarcophagae]